MSQCPYSKQALAHGGTFADGPPLDLMRQIRNEAPIT